MINRKDIFIEKAKLIHSNENIDYSKVEYVNNKTPVLLIDRDLNEDGTEYGEFYQTPSNHLKGQSHPLKRKKKISQSKSYNFEELVKRFNEVHNNENLDYSESVYVNMHTKIKIIDHDLKEDGTEYGEFWQEPCVHLKGCTHPLKGKRKQVLSMYSNANEFIGRCKLIHGNKKYDYSLVEYKNSREKVSIICNETDKNGKIHGLFNITPDNCLQGKGCPKCGNQLSYGEEEIADEIRKYCSIEQHNRSILNGKEIDIYIPNLKIGIEYNGNKWHCESFKRDKNYHLNKTIECNNKNINLIQIFEDEYVLHKDIVISKIKHIINVNINLFKIVGRECIVKEIDKNQSYTFLERFHIEGFMVSTIYLGAYYNNELIAVMSFIKCGEDGKWELNKFASNYNYVCCGVGGKLFNYFIKEYNPIEIESFADRRWVMDNESNIYVKLGFVFNGYLKPDYKYYNSKVDTYKRFHKFAFGKDTLHKKYGFTLMMSEKEMAKELGYDRIWDCGLIKYVWKKLPQ